MPCTGLVVEVERGVGPESKRWRVAVMDVVTDEKDEGRVSGWGTRGSRKEVAPRSSASN